MTKFIALHSSVTRCRPEAPLTKLHNDCGQQDKCARRLAANTDGHGTKDFSKTAYVGYGYTVLCTSYVSLANAASARDSSVTKPLQGVGRG